MYDHPLRVPHLHKKGFSIHSIGKHNLLGDRPSIVGAVAAAVAPAAKAGGSTSIAARITNFRQFFRGRNIDIFDPDDDDEED